MVLFVLLEGGFKFQINFKFRKSERIHENDFCGIFRENGIETILSSIDIYEFKDGILISFAIILFKF